MYENSKSIIFSWLIALILTITAQAAEASDRCGGQNKFVSEASTVCPRVCKTEGGWSKKVKEESSGNINGVCYNECYCSSESQYLSMGCQDYCASSTGPYYLCVCNAGFTKSKKPATGKKNRTK